MKKFYSLTLGILLICFCFCFSACAHDHTFEEKWSYDSDYHWHASTCGHEVKNNLERHTFDSANKCAVCGFVITDEYTKGLLFSINRATHSYTVEKGSATSVKIVIPAVYEGRPVLRIAQRAFRDSRITTVIIPDSIKEIGKDAFRDCKILVDIKIAKGIEIIGEDAFTGCISLNTIVFEETEGWSVDGEAISSEDLSNPERAAELLTTKTGEWTRTA